jgi:hypothetical protein
MSSTQEKPLDLSPLSDKYEVVGEYAALGQNRRYPGRRRDDGRDVLITVLRAAPDVAQGKAIAQFAADANLMAGLSHPNVPQVLEGRWIGDDAFALVTDRIHGVTLAELLRGERLAKPRIADILADVDGVLEWARNERLSHRAVSPESIWIERGTNRVFVTLAPMEAPKTNRPDPRDDARTIGMLALTALTAKPMTDEHDDTLLSKRPDLPERVATATEKLAACTINDETPDVSAYLASLAMADAIKEGEVEVARLESEFRATMKAEREKWEAEQEACRVDNENQAKKFAEERAEYERRAEKEREQLAAARAEIDKRRAEVQEARAELDAARAAFKEKKSALDARARQVERHMADLEKQKRALERRAAELEQRNLELQQFAALAASGSADAIAQRPTMEVPAVDLPDEVVPNEAVPDDEAEVPAQDPFVADAPQGRLVEDMGEAVEADDEVQGWTPIETDEPWAVPLESDEPVSQIEYEAAAVPEKPSRKRPAWAVPAGIAGVVVLLVGAAFAASRSRNSEVIPLTVATQNAAQTQPQAAAPSLRTDSAAGTIAPTDSAVFAAIRDSIVAADEARRARRQREAEAEAEAEAERTQRAQRTVTDSTGTVWMLDKPPGFGTRTVITSPGTTTVRPPTDPSTLPVLPPSLPPVAAPVVPPVRPDTGVRPRPDTIVRPKPDTLTCCRN